MNSATEMNSTTRVRPNEDEQNAYLNERHPDRPVCCLCRRRCDCPYGNNPMPVATKGKCCGTCNQVVIMVRMGIIPLELAKTNKRNLKMLYDLVVRK